MGFEAKNLEIVGDIKSPSIVHDRKGIDDELSKGEIEYLLLLIKDSNFRGEHLETVYNIVVKLQNQHINK